MEKHDIIDLAARTAHTINNAYREALGELPKPDWDRCDEALKDSARNGVEGIVKGHTPAQSHENWMAFKASQGWRYGAEENAELKTHPNMVAYEQLPPSQRIKDTIFFSVVRGILFQYGMS